VDDAVAGADFVSVFTQLLGAGATESAPDQGDAAEIDVDVSAPVTGAEFAAQMAINAIPVVADIAQALTNTQGAQPRTETDLGTSISAAIAARLQRPAVTGELAVTTTVQQKGVSDTHGLFAQSASVQTALTDGSAATAFASGNEARDNQQSKQDGSTGAMTGVGMTGAQAQTDAPRAELQIGARVGTHAWRDEVAGKLTWMIDRGIQHGTLRLSPENLGPMEVRITTQNDQVSVWFGAAHADTRAALENALPRLREMFAAQGLSLADAGVFREPPKDSPRGYTESNGRAAIDGVEERSFTVAVRDGLLDAYA
jgi:flagellar hook-length control protein FliK